MSKFSNLEKISEICNEARELVDTLYIDPLNNNDNDKTALYSFVDRLNECYEYASEIYSNWFSNKPTKLGKYIIFRKEKKPSYKIATWNGENFTSEEGEEFYNYDSSEITSWTEIDLCPLDKNYQLQ